MNIYVTDFSRCGIYKISLTDEERDALRQKIIDTEYHGDISQVPEEVDNMDNEEILYRYGFHTTDCSWLITDEDLEIETITEPLK